MCLFMLLLYAIYYIIYFMLLPPHDIKEKTQKTVTLILNSGIIITIIMIIVYLFIYLSIIWYLLYTIY